MYLSDVHTHSLISPDSKAPLSDMAASAIGAGLDQLCVTDHFDLLGAYGAPETEFDWEGALAQYHAVQPETAGRLELRLGLELGSAPYDPAVARKVLSGGGEELDFVLGSLHNWVGEQGNGDLYFTDFTDNLQLCRRAMENALNSTWKLVTECPDCYDSLAHIIYPLRYAARDGQSLSIHEYEEQVRAIFTEVARTDHALEVNTNRGKDLAVWLPILGWFRECGGRYVTLGSDAHRPQDVAKGIREGQALLRQAGFAHTTTFRRRKPELHPL